MSEDAEWIKISVKYRNACIQCRREIGVGEQALWLRGSKSIRHLECPPESVDNSPASVDENFADDNEGNSDNTNQHICLNCHNTLHFTQGMRFCPYCGASLGDEVTARAYHPNNHHALQVRPEVVEGSEEGSSGEGEHGSASIGQLGRRLEDFAEQIFKNRGYTTHRNQKLQGKSGGRHEIDIIARKGDKVVGVECKNYSSFVGIDEVRDFHGKLEDLSICNAVMATNSLFSKDAQDFAEYHHIRLWDGDYLRETLFQTSIGRYGAVEELVLPMALPVKATFEQASKAEIANSTAAKAANAKLIFHPYYKISYDLKTTRLDPARGRHSISDTGTYVVDGLDGDMINRKQSASSRLLSSLKSTEAKMQNKEQNHIVTDLLTIQPEANYKFKDTGEHYAIVKVRPDISFRTAIKTVVNEVIHQNSKDVRYTRRVSRDRVVRKKMAIVPYHDEVLVKKASLIYVPIWEMDIETSRIDYSRRVLAASGTIILDSIALCPKHLSIASAKLVKKQTYAVCELCGVALCKDHISNFDNRFYCDKDNPSKPTGNKEADKMSSLKKGFTTLLKRNKASLTE